jgi:phosphopentomutase
VAATTGTGHGSPFVYDREVPVLVRGPGVAHATLSEPVPQARVAATLAHFLGVEPPHAQAPLLGD